MLISKRFTKETARDYALRMINKNIISLDLEPGSLVSEAELSAEMGLSRTPVREALIELSKSKIVEILPQRGSRISLIDYGDVEESRFLRLVLENAIAKLACELEGMDFSRIDENITLQELSAKNGMPSRLLELDDQFHAELFRMCNKSQTYILMRSMTAHFDRVRSMSLTTIKDTYIIDDHKNILEAIKKSDVSKATELMSMHLARYKIDEKAIREKYPHYFK